VALEQQRSDRAPRAVVLLRLLLPIALIGVLGVMLEDAAQTWNTLYLADVLGAEAGLAALGYLVYTATLTGGRLVNDRLIDRWGNSAIARAGGLAAASGLGLVMLASPGDSLPLAVIGFGVVGLGAAPLFPVMIAAAASRPGISSAHAVGIVSWLARAGFAIAPVLVGAAADAWGLGAAFAIPLAAGLLVCLAARRFLGAR
jgi:MFS family permease